MHFHVPLLACSLLVVALTTPASASPAAKSSPAATPAPASALGRDNPYRPLLRPRATPAAPAVPLPSLVLPQAQAMPLKVPSMPTKAPARPASGLAQLHYVGVAYDGADAIAAVKVGAEISFLRLGARFDGAVITRITPNKLYWSKNHATVIKHLRRRKTTP